MSNNNSFLTETSNKGVSNQKKNTGQLADESNYNEEANLSRKMEFEKGMPLSFSFVSNKVFTIPFTFSGYLTFIWKKIAETPLNLCMLVVLLYYLITFLCERKKIKKLDLFFSISFQVLSEKAFISGSYICAV